MVLFWVLVGILVLGAVAVVAAGAGESTLPAGSNRAPLVLPTDRPVQGSDLDELRFAVEVRGYRMGEVDEVLDRVAADLAARDARIAELEAQLGSQAPRRAVSPHALLPDEIVPPDSPVTRAIVVPMEDGPE